MKENAAKSHVTVVESIGTANPPSMGLQSEAAEFMLRLEGLSPMVRDRIPVIYGRSGIDRRYTCVHDYLRPVEAFDFFPRNAALQPAPSTAARNRLYREWAPRIAMQAARDALLTAARAPADITHLIVVSCTGFFAP